MPLLLTHEDKNKDDDENADKFGGIFQEMMTKAPIAKQVLSKGMQGFTNTGRMNRPTVIKEMPGAPLFSNIGNGNSVGITDDAMKRMQNVGNNAANTAVNATKTPMYDTDAATQQLRRASSNYTANMPKPRGHNRALQFPAPDPRMMPKTPTPGAAPATQQSQVIPAAQPQPIPPGYGPGWADQKLLAFNNLIKNMATTTTAPVFSAARNNPKITNMLKYLTGLGTVGAATGVGINEIRGLYNNSPYTLAALYHRLRGHELDYDINGAIPNSWAPPGVTFDNSGTNNLQQ
jgi:hypothetical protein